MNNLLFCIFIFFSISKSTSFSSPTGDVCTEYQECSNLPSTTVQTMISCDGYESCQGTSFTSLQPDISMIYCYGCMACVDISVSHMKGIHCYGSGSCLELELYKTSLSDKLECNGYFSCATNSHLFTSAQLVSTGYRALAGAKIHVNKGSDTYLGVFYGYETLFGSKIHSEGMGEVELHFYGYKSLVKSVIYCEAGSKCIIICKYQSCVESYIYRDADSEIDIKCDDDKYCVEEIFDKHLPKLNSHIMKFNIYDYDNELLNINALIRNKIHNFINYNNKIICKNENECINKDIDGFNGVVECHGFNTCLGLTLDAQYINLYCTGDLSCNEGYYITSPQEDIRSVGYTYHICSGFKSCSNSIFENIYYILSLGYMSLENTFLKNINNIDIYGSELYQYTIILIEKNNQLNLNSYGFWSLNEAKLYIYGTLNANFYGYKSSVLTKIYCFKDSVCNIMCNKYSCRELKIYYEQGSDVVLNYNGEPDTNYQPKLILNKKMPQVNVNTNDNKNFIQIDQNIHPHMPQLPNIPEVLKKINHKVN